MEGITGGAAEPVQEIEALRDRLSRLSRAGLLINAYAHSGLAGAD